MIFKGRKIKLNRLLIPIQINNQQIGEMTHTKFLGVIVDNELSWKHHIGYIHNKISKGIGILYKAKDLVNKSTMKTLYYAFLYSYLNYFVIVWGNI